MEVLRRLRPARSRYRARRHGTRRGRRPRAVAQTSAQTTYLIKPFALAELEAGFARSCGRRQASTDAQVA